MEVKIRPRKATERGGYYLHATVHQYPAWEAGMENHTVSRVWGEMLEDPTGRDRREAGSPWIVYDVCD